MADTIHFQGKEYASRRAMPPEVRAAYDAEHTADAGDPRQLFETAARLNAGLGSADLKPAWGGAGAGGGVAVPVEFDGVNGLGRALAVHEHDGIRIFPTFGTPHPNVVVRYHEGLAYRTSGKEVHSLRYDEIVMITSNVSWQASEHGMGYTEHEYTLLKTGGDKVVLDNGLKNVGDLGEEAKKPVFARLGPPLAARYQAGEALAFGPVTVQRANGCLLDNQPYAWDGIRDIKVENGRFKVTLATGKKHEVRVSAIPNIELLCQLIGLRLLSSELAYM